MHFLPYAQDIRTRTVPDWLQYLEQMDLLISGAGATDFHFSQKLCSYALAYWACDTVRQATERFAVQGQQSRIAHFLASDNFQVTDGLHAPDELHIFDKQYELIVSS